MEKSLEFVKSVSQKYKDEKAENRKRIRKAQSVKILFSKLMEKLQEKYNKQVIPAMVKDFGYKSKMAVPKIVKVTINTSFGKSSTTKTGSEREKMVEAISQDIALIGGQRPKLVKAKKSIAGFKLREGLEVGLMVTLRKKRMWDFIERLIYVSLPKSRDFKGIDQKAIDNGGNLNIGFREHVNFAEIFTEKEKTIFGLQITVTTNAKTREEGLKLFQLLGFPIKKDKK